MTEDTLKVGNVLKILQLNIEGMTKAKSQYLSKLLLDNNYDVALIQEHHLNSDDKLNSAGKIYGYEIIGSHHGVATYVRSNIKDAQLISNTISCDVHVAATRIANTTIVNVYKPPTVPWPDTVLPTFCHPTLYAGDFNSHHEEWK